MTQLLVSVRNADEAQAALDGGADLIDIKEPRHGALGAAGAAVWRDVHDVVHSRGGRRPLSAALGELLDDSSLELAAQAAAFDYVKVGLAGCRRRSDWPRRWAALQARIPAPACLVAVVYADAENADAPEPWDVLHQARQMGLQTVLVDTWSKESGDLFAAFEPRALAKLATGARQSGMQLALAGSLRSATLPRALELSPDWIAVRGAACEQAEREGRVSASRVASLKIAIRHGARTQAESSDRAFFAPISRPWQASDQLGQL